MEFRERKSGIYIDDPERWITDGSATDTSLSAALSRSILSTSGWRAVMAASGEDEDSSEAVTEEFLLIAAASAATFVDYLGKDNPTIYLGCDARPTGTLLSAAVRRALIAKNANVIDIFISSAPEIMAASRYADGFFYISASHNPVGHNGFKFGVQGGVLSKEEMEKAIKILRGYTDHDGAAVALRTLIEKADPEKLERVLSNIEKEKAKALKSYTGFVLETAEDENPSIPFGIAIDFNGSARTLSIDMDYLTSHGAMIEAINKRPREIAHAIVPEGENLEWVRKLLEEKHKEDSRFTLGYMPDNDGDRGNFVYIAEDGTSRIMSAQTVFALVIAIELMSDKMEGVSDKLAVAVNGPTSLLIDEIASLVGATVFRSDIGEANVVGLGEKARQDGYRCRVSGEGSNGGNITYPAKVRDPLNSIMTFSKLWSKKGLYEYMMSLLGRKANAEPSIWSILDAFPPYITTSAFSADAVMKIKSTDYNKLKAEYERIFSESKGCIPEELGVAFLEERQYEGMEESIGAGPKYRRSDSTGGLKINLSNGEQYIGYLWLSKSRTEPVIRTMVDLKGGDKTLHDKLLKLQREMVRKADEAVLEKEKA